MLKDWQIAAYCNLVILEEHIPFGARGRIWHSVLVRDGTVRPVSERVAIGTERLRWLDQHRTVIVRGDES